MALNLFLAPVFPEAALLCLDMAAMAKYPTFVKRRFKLGELFAGKRNIPRRKVLDYALFVLRSRNGNDIGIFMKHPRQRYLGVRGLLSFGKSRYDVEHRLV